MRRLSESGGSGLEAGGALNTATHEPVFRLADPEPDPRPGYWDKCAHELGPEHTCVHCGVALSRVSGLPMRPVPDCPSRPHECNAGCNFFGDGAHATLETNRGVGHDWAPELHYGTSFGLVLFCRKCGRAAQCEIGPLPVASPRHRRPKMFQRRAKAAELAKRWAYCKLWKGGDLPHQPNHHRWPDTITVGPVVCQRCGHGAQVLRIYDHPGGDGGKTDPQVWVSRFAKVVPP